MTEIISPAGSLNKFDWKNIAKHAAFVAGAAIVSYILQQVLPTLGTTSYAYLIPILTTVFTAIQKYITQSVYQQ